MGVELELDHTKEHFVKAVHINGEGVRVVCSCNWESKEHPDETAGREEWDKHVAPKRGEK